MLNFFKLLCLTPKKSQATSKLTVIISKNLYIAERVERSERRKKRQMALFQLQFSPFLRFMQLKDAKHNACLWTTEVIVGVCVCQCVYNMQKCFPQTTQKINQCPSELSEARSCFEVYGAGPMTAGACGKSYKVF